MTAPLGKTVPPHVDNLKLPRTFTEYTECCYHLPDIVHCLRGVLCAYHAP